MDEFERIKRLQQRLEQHFEHSAAVRIEQDVEQRTGPTSPSDNSASAPVSAAPPASSSRIKVGIGDDAAVYTSSPGEDNLVTTDTMVEGVHFLPETLSWYDVGYKCLAASISDIAAMGGQPTAAVLALAIPKDLGFSAVEEMYDGIGAVAGQFQCQVVGGDLVSTTGPLVITSTVFGSVPEGTSLLRGGAHFGDVIFVTGEVGGSAAGLDLLRSGGALGRDSQVRLQQLHRRPLAQIQAGQILRECGASSCNDVSDGLASECNEIAEASGVRLRLEASRIPIAADAVNLARVYGKNPLDYALYGGEDYQLVGTAPPLAFAAAIARCESVGIRLTAIGRVEVGDGVVAELSDGQLQVLEPKGFNHFSES